MFKAIIAVLGLAFSFNASADTTIVDVLASQQQTAIMSQARTMGIDWKVGDNASYNIDMGFIKGTMVSSVRSVGAEGIWMDQNMDLGFAGKQQVQTLIDQNTGEVKKMLVNGKEQQVPKQDIEIISAVEDHITVPAGAFDCIHATIKDKSNNEEINAWINPQQIPMSGMLKQVQPSQFGQVTIELKSFKKN